MADNENSHIEEVKEKPLLIIHRLPSFTCFFHHRLATHFTLLDPTATVGTDTSAVQSYLRSDGSGARALVCVWASPLRKDTLDCLPSLELVVVACAGYNHIDLSECRRRGIRVANVGDVFSDDVADYTVGILLDVVRKFSAADRFVRVGFWPQPGEFPLGSSVSGLPFS
ncbi:glyoxylate/hydroxypyruvate reductase HPR3-like [Chenopodium quinoa]|uniref:glyoxylate/hydroxypyruvate reductase HPR3-like n=1 Tax=Chenopodium quinoa TaxID=63459 RepID=UPI000B77EF4D|nr:glyoxylate/hydroxypyruvate reductase HPR3-like [Chenopodium quinoa]